MSQIVRKQMSANSTEVFQIRAPTTAFLVKNYTADSIYVSAGNQFVEAESSMIAANTAEVVQAGVFLDSVTVHASKSGTVEVGRYDGRQIFPLAAGGTGSGVSDSSVTSDSDFDDMLSDVFGDGGTPSNGEGAGASAGEIDDGTIASEDEVDEMLDEIFGDNSGG